MIRGPLNQWRVAAFAEFRGDLYVTTSIQGGGYDRINNIGPAAGMRFSGCDPMSTWELVVGEPRMTSKRTDGPHQRPGPGIRQSL